MNFKHTCTCTHTLLEEMLQTVNSMKYYSFGHGTLASPIPSFTRMSVKQLTPCRRQITHLSWNQKVHYHVHRGSPLVPILSEMLLVNTSHLISVRSISILPSHLHLRLPCGPFPSGFLNKILYVFVISPMQATCPAHLILIFGESYKL